MQLRSVSYPQQQAVGFSSRRQGFDLEPVQVILCRTNKHWDNSQEYVRVFLSVPYIQCYWFIPLGITDFIEDQQLTASSK